MPQDYIIYQTKNGTRRITVIDGQPYYQSTGNSSNAKDVWFPFIMVRGTTPKLNIAELSKNYNRSLLKELNNESFDPGYIVKYELDNLNKYDKLFKKYGYVFFEGRIPDKTTLIASARLSGPNQYKGIEFSVAELTDEEVAFAQNYIEIANAPVFTTTNPDAINKWLIEQGAIAVTQLTKPVPVASSFFGSFFATKKSEPLDSNSIQNNLNVNESISNKTIAQLQKYINDRGTMDGNYPELNWRSETFRNPELTTRKMILANEFITKIKYTDNIDSLREMLKEARVENQNLEKEYRAKELQDGKQPSKLAQFNKSDLEEIFDDMEKLIQATEKSSIQNSGPG